MGFGVEMESEHNKLPSSAIASRGLDSGTNGSVVWIWAGLPQYGFSFSIGITVVSVVNVILNLKDKVGHYLP